MAAPVALVTGAASGIGAAIARELSSRGWAVGGLDLAAQSTHTVAHRQVDMADAAAVATAVTALSDELGPVAAAVSAAGHYEMVPVSQITPEASTKDPLHVHLGGASTWPGRFPRAWPRPVEGGSSSSPPS